VIKDTKIAEFTKAFTAAVIFALPSLSLAAMPNLKDLLSKPGVAEQLQASYGGKSTYDGQQDTPLVVQARKFALRINPPPPPEEVKPQVDRQPVRPQAVVSAKFKLMGTSYHIGDETKSWALIDEVGKGLHWVKQGDSVDRLNIEKVGDGSVLINDNGRKYELMAERPSKPDVVKSYTGTLEKKEPIVLLAGGEKITTAETVETIQPEQVTQAPAEPQVTPEEQLKQTQANIEWLKSLQSDPNSAGMSENEAKELSGLGEMLKTLETEAESLQSQNSAKQPKAEPNTPKTSDTVAQPKDQPAPVTNSEVKPQTAPNQPTGSTTDPTKLRRIRERRK
jgi:hypothetical protein